MGIVKAPWIGLGSLHKPTLVPLNIVHSFRMMMLEVWNSRFIPFMSGLALDSWFWYTHSQFGNSATSSLADQ